ncbi:nitrous oxide reductase family maturation protein NosD [Aestuariirhabdus haliotis]|uniref:nitrous oxide reductase family maturation protein NosD n=1 Tax=Aestuariirhabdus haliotis TaxID=2918751 RepID=UPI0020BFCFB5|nr:nitrous oxide reductase family maturation protein NosD [Aestuariirhabdus haliotis]MCL6421095.1 nitrous oxide reductase family maturation protein NosD [Aestuariirhabdus haliotis]
MNRMNLTHFYSAALLVGLMLTLSPQSLAATLIVTSDQSLQTVLDNAQNGDQLQLETGVYQGNFTIDREITLIGKKGAIIDGGGQLDALRVRADNVTITNLYIRNWGRDLTATNAGIFVDKASNTLISNNYLKGDAFGIWLDNTVSSRVLGNRVEGNSELRSADRGNGIHLSTTTDAEIRGNEVWHTRDGLYILTSNNNRLEDNYLHDLRFGVHYMYSNDNRVVGNRTERTRTGYALMQSTRLTVTDNVSVNDKNYGVLLNFVTYSTVANNHVEGVQSSRALHAADRVSRKVEGADGKALFVYNSLYNTIRKNLFADSDLGIHLTAGSEDNLITLNAFVGNRQQVKYVASREQEWSDQGRGNFWSDYLGWDMDGDGMGDVAYEPNDSMDQVLWRYPLSRVLVNAPAVELLRWVQREFPVFKAQGVRDSFPLMANPVRLKSGSIKDVEQGQVMRTAEQKEVETL